MSQPFLLTKNLINVKNTKTLKEHSMKNKQEELPSDKFRNHLSIFLFVSELKNEDLDQPLFTKQIQDAMKTNYNKMATLAALMKKDSITNELNKLATSIIVINNYIDGYKSKNEVFESLANLKLEESINNILKEL